MTSGDIVFYVVVVAIPLIAVFYLITKNQDKIKDFKPVLFSETVTDNLKKMVGENGIDCGGIFSFILGTRAKLKIGYQTVADIDAYIEQDGEFSGMIFNPTTKQMDHDKKYDRDFKLVILRAKSSSFLWRLRA